MGSKSITYVRPACLSAGINGKPKWEPEADWVTSKFHSKRRGCPSIVDKKFAHELTEMHYRTSTFVLEDLPFNHEDAFRYSDGALSGLLHRVTFAGRVFNCINRLEVHFSEHTFGLDEYDLPFECSVKDQMITHLVSKRYAALTLLKTNCSVKLVFSSNFMMRTRGANSRDVEIWRRLCGALLPMVRRMECNGCLVSVRVDRKNQTKIPIQLQSWNFESSAGQYVSQCLESQLKVCKIHLCSIGLLTEDSGLGLSQSRS